MPRIKFDYYRIKANPSPAFPNQTSTTQPYIPTTFINGDKKIGIYALVDSGAYATLLSSQICPILGIKLEDGKESVAVGISGLPQRTFFHNIRMEVGGYTHECYVGFVEGQPVQAVLLGQKCFFHHFKKVIFDYNGGEIELIW